MIYKYKAWVGSGNEYDEDAIIQDEISSSWDPDHPRWVAEDVAKELFKEGLFEKEINIRIYDSAAGDDLGLFKVSAVPTHTFYAVEVK